MYRSRLPEKQQGGIYRIGCHPSWQDFMTLRNGKGNSWSNTRRAALSRHMMLSIHTPIAKLALTTSFFHYAACWKTDGNGSLFGQIIQPMSGGDGSSLRNKDRFV